MTSLADAYQWLRAARDDGNENTDALHPILAWRVYLTMSQLWDDYGPRVVTIESAARTLAEQVYLYTEWRAGRFPNLVANPWRTIARTPIGPMRGSWHMVQSDGHAHAVDITRPGTRIPWASLHAAGRANGLVFPVPSEPWHAQALTSSRLIPGPLPPPAVPPPIIGPWHTGDVDTLIDTSTGEGWAVAGTRARALSDVDGWVQGLEGGRIIRQPNMRFIVRDLYELVG